MEGNKKMLWKEVKTEKKINVGVTVGINDKKYKKVCEYCESVVLQIVGHFMC